MVHGTPTLGSPSAAAAQAVGNRDIAMPDTPGATRCMPAWAAVAIGLLCGMLAIALLGLVIALLGAAPMSIPERSHHAAVLVSIPASFALFFGIVAWRAMVVLYLGLALLGGVWIGPAASVLPAMLALVCATREPWVRQRLAGHW